MNEIILSGNCNWCTEAMYQRVKGITNITPGHYNITIPELAFSPKDRIEALYFKFNPDVVSLDSILDIFFISHNPTLVSWVRSECFYPLNRSSIIVESEENIQISEARLAKEKAFHSEAVNTKIIQMQIENFKASPEKEKNYYINNPNDGFCQSIIEPRLDKMKKQFSHLLKAK